MSKWWAANWKNRLLFALRHPGYALQAVSRDLFSVDERFLSSVTGTSVASIRRFMNEPFEERAFLDHMNESEPLLQDVVSAGAELYAKRVVIQYAVVRAQKPNVVVETGVANGVSSAYLLLALHLNQKGHLHSIDVGDRSFLPPCKETGWIVPGWLRNRWTLHMGDSRKLLPEVLGQFAEIDVFIHDSLHTQEHMKFEYEKAYPSIRSGGVLISDDALWNPAFPEFARAVGASAVQIMRGVGVLQKQLL
jgi:predicted O-methyltransferase YrrM